MRGGKTCLLVLDPWLPIIVAVAAPRREGRRKFSRASSRFHFPFFAVANRNKKKIYFAETSCERESCSPLFTCQVVKTFGTNTRRNRHRSRTAAVAVVFSPGSLAAEAWRSVARWSKGNVMEYIYDKFYDIIFAHFY